MTIGGNVGAISKSPYTFPVITDLSTVDGNYTALNLETLTGTLAGNYMISIAAGATVTLKDMTIGGTDNSDYQWAGITCLGNATIILEGTNSVEGSSYYYPGIHVPKGSTLTIRGAIDPIAGTSILKAASSLPRPENMQPASAAAKTATAAISQSQAAPSRPTAVPNQPALAAVWGVTAAISE